MFIGKNKVRMHDTDMAGRLYFARQFRFAHDALEDFCESEGFNFNYVFHEAKFVFVIVHCEADYFAQLFVGDTLNIHLTVEKIGSTSFTLYYEIYKDGTEKKLVGTVKTVHVTLHSTTGEKISIPADFKKCLEKHLVFKETLKD